MGGIVTAIYKLSGELGFSHQHFQYVFTFC